MKQEIWKVVDGFNGCYRVSNLGNFESCINNGNHKVDGIWRKKKANKRKNGYYVVSLTENGKTSLLYLHRLVAQAFCENPNGYNEIDHIDSNKENNVAENLRWVTHKENIHNPHAIKERDKLAKKRGVSISQYTIDNVYIRTFYSLRQIEKEMPNVNRVRVRLCADGKIKSVCGYIWKYTKNNI